MSSRADQVTRVITLLERFVNGEDRSLQLARVLEGELEAAFPDDPRFEDVVLALASYQPGGGDYLYDEQLILPLIRQAFEIARAERQKTDVR
jgi:hypothetical protein